MYDLSLWEFNACVRAYNAQREAEGDAETVRAWRTANFTGAAFANKLKPLKHYLGEKAVTAPTLSAEQQARIDKKFEERRRLDGAE